MRPGKKLSSFTRTEVTLLFKNARAKVKLPGLRILRAPASGTRGRALIVTPRKVGNAPERNLLRRRIKAIYRENKLYAYPYDCVFLLGKECLLIPFEELSRIIHSVMT
jgi:ribonuclease P protein component